MRFLLLCLLVLPCSLLTAADVEAAVETANAAAAETADEAGVKAAIQRQLDLIKAGKVTEVAAGFTERLRADINADVLAKAAVELAEYTLADLVAKVAITVDGDTTLAEVDMPGGRSLTTLIFSDGHWLADTIWFR